MIVNAGIVRFNRNLHVIQASVNQPAEEIRIVQAAGIRIHPGYLPISSGVGDKLG
jgi:hypothetical protein